MSELEFRLPGVLGPNSMFSVINALIKEGHPAATVITLDFSQVRFVESAGVAFLSNLVEWLRKRGAGVHYRDANPALAGVRYLDDVGFFETYWEAHLSKQASVRSTTYPFRRLTLAESHQWLDGKVFPWIADKMEVSPNSLREFQTCIRELFQNIDDHSTEKVGCMHVQWHPNVKRVKIAVSDFGIGIPSEVRKAAPGLSDPAAISQATRDGFSSKGGKNRGAGLAYLVDNVVGRNLGWLGIYSGAGQVAFDGTRLAGKAGFNAGIYPGTLVSMVLRTDTIQPEESAEDMSWL